MIYSGMSAEQTLDMGVYIVRFRVYLHHFDDAVLELTVVNFQVRYFRLSYVMYVNACCKTYYLIPDRFTRIFSICAFKPDILSLLS